MHNRIPIFVIMLLISTLAAAQTSFTYQGRLDESGQPQNGTVGMVFELFDAETGGSQVGPTRNRNVEVTDGLFQVELDFGNIAYEQILWLAITVNGTPLEPRQRIVAVPMAVRAQQAQVAQTLEGPCPTLDPSDEMIRVGGLCVDKYEASIWDAPVGGNQITGALPCSDDGQDCDNIYARSVQGVQPRGHITWFQAQQALANSGKRFLTNAEWQMAVAGTPDHPGPCNTDSESIANTGADSGCVSSHGIVDMVGNVMEFVADWQQQTDCSPGWGTLSDDLGQLCGAKADVRPAAMIRGGSHNVSTQGGSEAGPFATNVFMVLGVSSGVVGFRGGR